MQLPLRDVIFQDLERELLKKDVRTNQNWSGKRDLNPRPSPWQGDALPLSYSRPIEYPGEGSDSTELESRCQAM